MAAFHPRAEDLPSEFPVFPLAGALLLPRGKLPLNIFEPRYKALTEDSLGGGRMFGMIQPDATQPDGPTGPALFRIGCLGRLSSFSETEDGRYQITLTGVIRFAVVAELEERRGYRRVRGEVAAFLDDLDLSARPIEVARDTPADGATQLLHPSRGRGELGRHQAAARRRPGDHARHGLPVRTGGETGAAGGAQHRRPGGAAADAAAHGFGRPGCPGGRAS